MQLSPFLIHRCAVPLPPGGRHFRTPFRLLNTNFPSGGGREVGMDKEGSV